MAVSELCLLTRPASPATVLTRLSVPLLPCALCPAQTPRDFEALSCLTSLRLLHVALEPAALRPGATQRDTLRGCFTRLRALKLLQVGHRHTRAAALRSRALHRRLALRQVARTLY